MSPDGQFFWDGRQWLPTGTPDGRWHWNGLGWDPTAATNPNDPPGLAQTLLAQAAETDAQAGALLAARRGEWAPDPAAEALLGQADHQAGAVQSGNAQLAAMSQQNLINRALTSKDRKRIEDDLAHGTAALRAVIIQIGRTAPATTFADADLLLSSARTTEAQAVAINEALTALQQAEAAHATRLTAAQERLRMAEAARATALAASSAGVQAAEQAYFEAVASARAHLGEARMPGSGDVVGAFGGAAIYANHIQTVDGRGLTAGCEVFVGTGAQLLSEHSDLVAEAMALSSTGAAALHEAESEQSDVNFLLLSAKGLRSIVAVPRGQEAAAAEFAAKATEGSSAAKAAALERRSGVKAARVELDRVTADRAAIEAVETERKSVEADPELLSGVESARTAVAEEEANTAELEAARRRLAAVVATAVTPPSPLGSGPGV